MLTAVCPEEERGATVVAVVMANHVVSICVFSYWPLCPTCNQDRAENGSLVWEYLTSGAQALAGRQKAALLVVARVSYGRADAKGKGLLCRERSLWPAWGMFPAALEIFLQISARLWPSWCPSEHHWCMTTLLTVPAVISCKACPHTFKCPWAWYVQLRMSCCWSCYKALQWQFIQSRLSTWTIGYKS